MFLSVYIGFCYGLTWQASQYHTASHLLTANGKGKEPERYKWKNLWVEIRTVYCVKPKLQASQNKTLICYFPSADSSATSPQAGLIMHNDFLGRQTASLHTSPFSSSLPQLLLLSMIPHDVQYPLSPTSSLCIPSPRTGETAQEAETFFALCSTALWQLKPPCVINTVFIKNLKHGAIQSSLKKINSVQAKTDEKFMVWCYLVLPGIKQFKMFLWHCNEKRETRLFRFGS